MLSCLCFSQDVQLSTDYREKTQSLSQQIHGTLDELRAQQKLSETQLVTVENALKLSEERVKGLEKQVKDLTISSQSMNERLGDYSTKLTASELEKKRIKKQRNVSVAINVSFLVLLVLYTVLKVRKLIPF